MADTPPPVTPSQAAAASSAQVVAERIAEQEARVAESLNIVDPGQQRPVSITTPGEAPPPPKQRPLPGATVAHPPELLEHAAEYGLSAEEAKEYTPAQLRRTLALLDQQQGFEPEPQQTQQQFDPRQLPPGTFWDGQRWVTPQEQLPFGALKPPADGQSEWDPALQEAFSARDKWMQEQLRQAQQAAAQAAQLAQQAHQTAAQQAQAQQLERFDTLVGSDAAYKDVLGEGPVDSLPPEQRQARIDVAHMYAALRDNYVRQGRNPPAMQTLVKRAIVAVHGDRAQRTAETALQDRLRNRAGQFVARPTATTRQEGWERMPHGEVRAEQALAEAMRHMRNGNN